MNLATLHRAVRLACLVLLLVSSSTVAVQAAPPRKPTKPSAATSKSRSKGKSASASATDTPSLAIPHEAACRKLAARIEESLNRRDPTVINQALDAKALTDRALRGAEVSPEETEKIQQAIKATLAIGQTIVEAMGTQGSYKFLRLRHSNGHVRLLFRMLMGDEAFNYHEYLVDLEERGRPRIVDVFTFANGETISAELRRRMLALLAVKSQGLTKVTPFERDFVLHLKQIRQFEELGRRNDPMAIQAYHQLPDSIKAAKFAITIWLNVAMRAEVADEYRRALEAFARFFPNDPGMIMQKIDLHLLSKGFDQALLAVDALDKRVGGDAYLNVMRADVELTRPNLQKARRYAQAALRQEPDLIPAHVTLVAALLLDKNFEDLPRALDTIEKIPGAPPLPVDTDAAYAEFRESPSYKKWRALKQSTKAL